MSISINPQEAKTANMLSGTTFNNRLWRQLIEETSQEIDHHQLGFQVISPWGFEVTNDKNFLAKKLRRFYCYIGFPQNESIDRKKIASEYSAALHKKLSCIEPQLYNEIVLLIEQDAHRKLRPNDYICQANDKLIDIQVRTVKEDILTDYADYLICTLSGMLAKKGESRDMLENKVCRWRFYQLYIIQEKLFGYLLPPFTEEQLKAYRSIFILTDNMIQVFYSPHLMIGLPNSWETHVINFLINERLNLIKTAIVSGNNNITIRSLSYHIEEEMELTLSEDIYHKALSRIKRTYLDFI